MHDESVTMQTINLRQLCHEFESNSTASTSPNSRKRRWTPAKHEDFQIQQASTVPGLCIERDRAFERAEHFNRNDRAGATQPDADPCVDAIETGAFAGYSEL